MEKSRVGSGATVRGQCVQPRTAQVGPLVVSAFSSIEDCARHVLDLARAGQGGAAIAINAEKVIACRASPEVLKIVAGARLLYPDGTGVVLAMRKKGVSTARVAGADLWLAILRSAPPNTRVAIIGASPTVLRATLNRIGMEFPHAEVVLSRDGYGGARDLEELARAVSSTSPSLVFVAMGSPRQEQVINRLMQENPRAIYMGLGGSLDIYTGFKRRAPLWMRRAGLEWLYRLVTEPNRIRRQLSLPFFVWLMITNQI